jgi:NAD(P)-dependent dehydrogenase (short-subunit alcohol dehydrogenase family)
MKARVTGPSRGIGRAFALRLARDGAGRLSAITVVVARRASSHLDAVPAES